jgi:hypothetical protein
LLAVTEPVTALVATATPLTYRIREEPL